MDKHKINIEDIKGTKYEEIFNVNEYARMIGITPDRIVLPDNLTVDELLITEPEVELPNNLTVNKYLYLKNYKSETLPDDLTIKEGAKLGISCSEIKELPKGLNLTKCNKKSPSSKGM